MTRDDVRAHLAFFEELGVPGLRREPVWRSRAIPDPPRPRDLRAVGPASGTAAAPASPVFVARGLQPPRAEPEALPPVPIVAAAPAAGAVPGAAAASSGGVLALEAIRQDLGADCRRCKLHRMGRRQVVFGVGNPDADLLFVGEGPGADEDIKGEPFVGRAGQLLTRIIEAIGLRREQVYIANVIKCRPPENRNPEPDEIEQCQPFLVRQIDAVRPKVIVALGKFAAQTLLQTTEPITRLRGRDYRYRDAILVPTYHPAYLLRNPEMKRDVWEDMKRVRAMLQG